MQNKQIEVLFKNYQITVAKVYKMLSLAKKNYKAIMQLLSE